MTAAAERVLAVVGTLSDYHVEVARDFDGLARLVPALQEALTSIDFFSTWHWFANLSRHGVEPGFERLLVIVRQRASGAAFCLPLLRRPKGSATVFGPVLGGLSNYYSSLYGPIGDARHLSVDALRAAFAHLRRHHRPCGVLDLQPLDTGCPFYDMALQALKAEGYRTDSYFCFGNWHLDVAGRSFASYEPSIPSRLRNTIKRGRKKLDSSGAWAIQVHAATGAALETAIADFKAIYAKSWKVPEPFPHFVPELCRTAAAQGWLRLGVLRFEDQPIAAQLWIVKDRRAMIYKLAYDEDFKRFSAGSVLSAELMRRAIDDDGVIDVDYLTGDDGYKVDWMSDRRARKGIVAFDPGTAAGLLGLLKHRAGLWRRRRRSAASVHPPATDVEAA